MNFLRSKRRDPCSIREVPLFWISHHDGRSGSDEVGSCIIVVLGGEKGLGGREGGHIFPVGGFIMLVDLISLLNDRSDRLFVLVNITVLEGGLLGVNLIMIRLILLCVLVEVCFLHNSMCHYSL